VGDSAFWNELRLYTSDQWGKGATSEDLQKALDAVDTGSVSTDKKSGSSGRRGGKKSAKNNAKPLDNLFDMWVYGISNAPAK
jgi:hypothetical protein